MQHFLIRQGSRWHSQQLPSCRAGTQQAVIYLSCGDIETLRAEKDQDTALLKAEAFNALHLDLFHQPLAGSLYQRMVARCCIPT